MKNTFLISLIILITCVSVKAVRVTTFKDNFKAPFVLLDDKQLYVWDQSLRIIRIYSRKDFQKIAEFGRHGVGPGEFIGISKVSLRENDLCVASYPKLCFFSKDGKLIKEQKDQGNAGGFIPFRKNFVGVIYPYSEPKSENYLMRFVLVDPNLKEKKNIFEAELKKFLKRGKSKEIITWESEMAKAVVCNDKLYIGDSSKGLYFAVFDLDGDMLYKIERKYEKRKITDEDKQSDIDTFIKERGESAWIKFKATYDIIYPDYFPAFMNFSVANDKIYIFPYPQKNTQEYIVLDSKGNTLKQKKAIFFDSRILETDRFCIFNGKLYYMIDNDKTEQWELHSEQID